MQGGSLSQGIVLHVFVKVQSNALGSAGEQCRARSLFRRSSEFTWLTEIFLLLQL